MAATLETSTTNSGSDLILLLEDSPTVVKGFQQFLEDSEMKIQLFVCQDYQEYDDAINHPDIRRRVKCIVMDLSNNSEEENSGVFKATGYIKEQYSTNRIPIFIHSGYLAKFQDFEDKGTVFKIAKGTNSIEIIGESITLMHQSGFLDIFALGGSLESKIMLEIHTAFTEQFKPAEIQGIIKSIKDSKSEDVKTRTHEVFQRLAIRAVYQNIISNRQEIKVNSIEHYYRRTDTRRFWTGDLFKSNESENPIMLFVATPRCNILNKNYDHLLFYKINPIKNDQLNSFFNSKIENKNSGESKGGKQIRTNITDDVTNPNIAERFRFLPPTPQFDGGYVDCRNWITIDEESFLNNYSYKISLIDDLANDVVRKAAAYLLRGGISDTDYIESAFYIKEQQSVSNATIS